MPSPAPTVSRTPTRLPLLYFGFAHLCLAASLAALAVFPDSFTGFFYHPRMLAAVHLVTLGWITSHILGALYMIAPMALRTRLLVTRADHAAFWIYAVAVAGMVSHFWIAKTLGMVWAAPLVIGSIVWVGARTLAALRGAAVDAGVKLHYVLAFANVIAAGTLGILLGIHRLRPFLHGEPLSDLFAHVHLAALGWATMTVFGSAHRLLPMMLPSAPPPAKTAWAGALLLEAGALGLVACFLTGAGPLWLFALMAAGSVAWFLGVVVWMLRHRRRPGPGLPRFDATRAHALQAMLYLLLATTIGVALSIAPRSTTTLRLAKVYAVCGLLGFFGGMILGVAGRHLPVLLWTRRMHEGVVPAFAPYQLGRGDVAMFELLAWTAGVPLLAVALWLEMGTPLAAAAALLLAAVAASALNHVIAARRVLESAANVGAG